MPAAVGDVAEGVQARREKRKPGLAWPLTRLNADEQADEDAYNTKGGECWSEDHQVAPELEAGPNSGPMIQATMPITNSPHASPTLVDVCLRSTAEILSRWVHSGASKGSGLVR
jgi:hypothetical protein